MAVWSAACVVVGPTVRVSSALRHVALHPCCGVRDISRAKILAFPAPLLSPDAHQALVEIIRSPSADSQRHPFLACKLALQKDAQR
jgi:hypothetical protein